MKYSSIIKINSLLKDKGDSILYLFITINFMFLTIDILYAHSVNNFAHWAEWIPFYFSIAATATLFLARLLSMPLRKFTCLFLGALSVILGIAGFIFHLESQFFQDNSLKSLVYTAPFVAPLSYCGLGFLLSMSYMTSFTDRSWSYWVIFFGYLGFLGNFILSVCDHAQNDFYYWTEWIPVFSSALVLGFIPFFISPKLNSAFSKVCYGIVYLQIVVGLIGGILHLWAVYRDINLLVDFTESALSGAPLFAPYLFVNLAILLLIGMYYSQTETLK